MTNLQNAGLNAVLKQFSGQAPGQVVRAIQNASAKTGVDFAYLMQQANAESSFNPAAKAKTSSASGLFQFIKSTWIDMVNRHGDKYGVNVKEMSRQELLDLRFDPEIASHMAAEFASENKAFLERNWGGDVGATEMYFAHFLGAGGAASFLRAKDQNPLAVAADIFPKAAAANRNVFYDHKTGKPRSIAQVYDFFDKKFAIKDVPSDTQQPKGSTLPSASGAINSVNALQGSIIMASNGASDNSTHAFSRFNRADSAPFINSNDPTTAMTIQRHQQPKSSLFNKDLYASSQSVVRVRKTNPMPLYNLVQSPVDLMLLADMGTPLAKNGNTGKSKLL